MTDFQGNPFSAEIIAERAFVVLAKLLQMQLKEFEVTLPSDWKETEPSATISVDCTFKLVDTSVTPAAAFDVSVELPLQLVSISHEDGAMFWRVAYEVVELDLGLAIYLTCWCCHPDPSSYRVWTMPVYAIDDGEWQSGVEGSDEVEVVSVDCGEPNKSGYGEVFHPALANAEAA